ncbi:MAG: hypothetical protein ACOY82_02295 [Pseudomonadota bacterium]
MAPAARIAFKLCAAALLMPSAILAGHLMDDLHEGVEVVCSLVFVLGLASAFLYLLELRRALLEIEHPGWPIRLLRALIALPQAAAGLLSLSIGLAIMGWVLYNSLFERLPAYSGGFLTFGVSTALVLFGFGLLRAAFSRGAPAGERPPVS